MTDPQEPRFVLHWGYLMLVVILLITAGSVLLTLGWRWLWIAPAVVGSLILTTFVATLFEDRWRMVTHEDVARGVSPECSDCGHELDILRKTRNFKLRCPVCGKRESGVFHP